MAFSRWTAQPGAWRRPGAGAPSTRTGARHKARRDPGPVREDPARVARGPVAILQRAIASAMITLFSSNVLHARSTARGGRLNDNDYGLPKLIRRRRPPFLLRDEPHAIAVQSIALAGRERAPMTQAISSSITTSKHGNMRRRRFMGCRDRTHIAIARDGAVRSPWSHCGTHDAA